MIQDTSITINRKKRRKGQKDEDQGQEGGGIQMELKTDVAAVGVIK